MEARRQGRVRFRDPGSHARPCRPAGGGRWANLGDSHEHRARARGHRGRRLDTVVPARECATAGNSRRWCAASAPYPASCASRAAPAEFTRSRRRWQTSDHIPQARPPRSALTARRSASGDTVYFSGQIPLDPRTTRARERRRAAANSRRSSTTSRPWRRPPAARSRSSVRLTVYLTDLAHFAARQRDHGASTSRALSGARRGRRRTAAARCRRRGGRHPGALGSRAIAPHLESRSIGPSRRSRASGRARRARSAKLGVQRRRRSSVPAAAALRGSHRVAPARRACARARKRWSRASIELAEVALRRRRSLLCRIVRRHRLAHVRFFHFTPRAAAALWRAACACAASARSAAGPTGLEMVHPEYRVSLGPADEGRLRPHADLSDDRGLAPADAAAARSNSCSRDLSGTAARRLLARSLAGKPCRRSARRLRSCIARRRDAPTATCCSGGMHPSQRRLALEELVAQRLSLRRTGAARCAPRRACPLAGGRSVVERFRATLPFELTARQERAVAEILRDLARRAPMNRLVQGRRRLGQDRGRGASPRCVAAAAGCQTAVMAPTELLAEQHLASFERWLAPLGIVVAPLLGSQPAAGARGCASRRSRTAAAAVVVGTHALFQEAVAFRAARARHRRRAASFRRAPASAASSRRANATLGCRTS